MRDRQDRSEVPFKSPSDGTLVVLVLVRSRGHEKATRRALDTDDQRLCPLVDRAVQITLQRIDPEKRLDERKLAQEIKEAAPEILGALLDGLVHGLQVIDSIQFDHLPRMADSAKWIAACLPGMGLDFETWRRAYQESQTNGIETSLESSLTAKALLAWWNTSPGDPWIGTPKELYDHLIDYVPEVERRYFPANPKSLSDHLRRDAPALRQRGIIVRTGLHRWLEGVSKRVVEVSSVPPTDRDPDSTTAAPDRPLDAESLTQDAALTQEFSAASRHNHHTTQGLTTSLTHLTQDSPTLTPKEEKQVVEVDQGGGGEVADSCVKVRQGDINSNNNNDLRLDAPENPCVNAASRSEPCVKEPGQCVKEPVPCVKDPCVKEPPGRPRFWVGNKVALKAYPDVKGEVNGYFPYSNHYALILADGPIPEAVEERVYRLPGNNERRINVSPEEIVLCQW
jgi:hypothetical protein